ncbi:MAG: helix-turn-helix transcriptional regulator [Clostridia bacterium]|nr:helix-turn-helix transcriptional regulator [Clostridia bacterium]
MIHNYDNLSFQILSIGKFVHQDGVFYVKARPFAALAFRAHGSGTLKFVNKQSIITLPGDVFYLPANMPYKAEYSSSESIVVHLEQCNYFTPESIQLNNPAKIAAKFQLLLDSWEKNFSVNQAKSILYDILVDISEDKKKSVLNDTVKSCINTIELNFQDCNLNIEDLCQKNYISVSTLQRAFREYTGTSPKQYLITLRINQALSLLINTNLSIREISTTCGFADDKYFSRAFKKRYGYSPTQLRKSTIHLT